MNNTLVYNNYLGSVDYSGDDEIFYGRILGISDRISYDGDSVKALKVSFVEAVDDYIQTCREIGKEPEITLNGKLDIHVAPELHKKLVGFTAKYNRSLDETVEEALRRLVG